MRLLCVEDDYHVTDGLKTLCQYQGIDCDTAMDGVSGLKQALNYHYDMIVLDIMLPKIDGFEVLNQLRSRNINTPVIMLTARGTIEDKVRSLKLGADDYMVKPIMASEFFARIHAIIRRHEQDSSSAPVDDDSYKLGNIVFYPYKNVVSVNGKMVRLTPKEAGILEILIKNPRQVVERDDIIHFVWGHQNNISKNSLEIYIHKLRKKLEGANIQIHTVRKFGYVIEE